MCVGLRKREKRERATELSLREPGGSESEQWAKNLCPGGGGGRRDS